MLFQEQNIVRDFIKICKRHLTVQQEQPNGYIKQ